MDKPARMRWWSGLLVAAALCAAGAARADKDPVVAAALGGMVGFGAGEYYNGHTGTGLAFTGGDAALLGGVIYFASAKHANDVVLDPNTGLYEPVSWSIGSLLLIGRLFEGYVGYVGASPQRRHHRDEWQATPMAAAPPAFALGFTNGPLGDWSGAQIDAQWSAGRDGRERALLMSRLRQGTTGFRLNLGVQDPGVGLTWSTRF
jgi:hypothetical protein